MIRRYAAVFRLTLAACDTALALLVVLGAVNYKFGRAAGWWPNDVRVALPDTNLAVAVFVGMWIGVLWMHGLYRSRARWTRRGEIAVVLRATLIQLVLTLSLLYVFKLPDVSRLLLIVVFPLLAAAAIGVRIVMRQVLVLARDHGRNARYMLILGANARAQAFADLVECHPELGLVVIGHVKADAADGGVVLLPRSIRRRRAGRGPRSRPHRRSRREPALLETAPRRWKSHRPTSSLQHVFQPFRRAVSLLAARRGEELLLLGDRCDVRGEFLPAEVAHALLRAASRLVSMRAPRTSMGVESCPALGKF